MPLTSASPRAFPAIRSALGIAALLLASAILLPSAVPSPLASAPRLQPESTIAVEGEDALPPEYAAYLVRNRSVSPDGAESYFLQAGYHGVPIYGSYVWLSRETPSAPFDVRSSGAPAPVLDGRSASPAIGGGEAIASFRKQLERLLGGAVRTAADGIATEGMPEPRASLLFYPYDHRVYLAYEVELPVDSPEIGDWIGYVDAGTGRLIDHYNRLSEAKAASPAPAPPPAAPIGWGRGKDGTLRSFYVSAEKRNGKTAYTMIDATRPATIKTFDFRQPSSSKDRPEGYNYIASGTTVFGDAAAVDAHYNAKRVYLFYKNKYGRNSIDDKNMDILSFVHVNNSEQARNNAFWSGWAMYYGDGTGLKKGGVDCTSCAFDLTAHELTHGVTQYTVGLEYRGQSGALNEAISDIMAAVMDADDWEIGEDTGAAVRSLADPAKYGQASDMSGYVQLPEDAEHDNGGVHANSGIPAHAGYLTALKIDNADIGLNGRDTLGRLTYIMLRDKLLSPTADFYEARDAYVAAASRLAGLTKTQKMTIAAKVRDAWLAVGIGERTE